ncbi:peptidoglycan-binding domain-containing protein [Pararhizobium sp.]|uniref:peptidoglycan-binding domain-containing protein n=1 Tax=Pararhizobium sp. TaxID=1977563 RepID=UPI002715E3A8|nr:peptidoglycan-binding domain-containing protein [Pararhizobium sp.]MDO9417322.1 peptidoglycan-binding domain-containing protein [Pararhizobium sp.]
MTTRKRKSPDKKKPVARQSLILRALLSGAASIVHLLAKRPAVAGGIAAFAVVFSFVAANAVWYQPGKHPSPFMRTRLPQTASLDKTETGLPTRKVTTFVIEREDTQAGKIASDSQTPKSSPLVLEIQKQLAMRGFFEGDADGLNGPKTSSAIARFERQSGRTETGLANAQMLGLLLETPDKEPVIQTAGTGKEEKTVTTPKDRPFEEVQTASIEADPVAAAIREAEGGDTFIPKVGIPAASGLVMKIQKGLANLAYSGIAVDGVAGDQTMAAIRHFEKHYRLPQTGQPNEKVLKKLKEIGAI